MEGKKDGATKRWTRCETVQRWNAGKFLFVSMRGEAENRAGGRNAVLLRYAAIFHPPSWSIAPLFLYHPSFVVSKGSSAFSLFPWCALVGVFMSVLRHGEWGCHTEPAAYLSIGHGKRQCCYDPTVSIWKCHFQLCRAFSVPNQFTVRSTSTHDVIFSQAIFIQVRTKQKENYIKRRNQKIKKK